MNFRSMPAWLAVFPGLLAGWLVFRMPESSAVESAKSVPARAAVRPGLSAEEDAGGSAEVAPAKRRFPLAKEKLAILGGCQRQLTLDFTAFGTGVEYRSGSAFEILRQVLDLTPTEESALMKEFTRSSNELVAHEKESVRNFSVSPGKMAFQIETGGPFYDAISHRIAETEVAILGESRALMFAAITGSANFCSAGAPSSEPRTCQFEATIDRANGFQRIGSTITGGELRLISDGLGDPLKQDYGRFEHLIDDAAKLRFREVPEP